MTKEALEASISTLNSWILLFAIASAFSVVGGALLGVRQWQQNRELSKILHVEAQERQMELERQKEKTAQIELISRQAQIELENERVERLKLQAKLHPRSISKEARNKLVGYLRKRKHGDVAVTEKTFDEESHEYATEITDIFREADFPIDQKAQLDLLGTPYFGKPGIFLFIKDAQKMPPHAKEIRKAFQKIGITLDYASGSNWLPNTNIVVIGVGAKPGLTD
jgi:transposase-like protein